MAEAERDRIVQRSLDERPATAAGVTLAESATRPRAEANAATAQVRGLQDRILDGEAAAIAVEMIALAAIRPPHRPA